MKHDLASSFAVTSAGKRRIGPAVLVLATVLGLLGGALVNGFPLIHPDSGTYLRVAVGIGWPVDRSGFYGFFLQPFLAVARGSSGLWLGIATQALAIALILVAALRRLAPKASAVAAVGVLGPSILFTALPWQAGQLMPDAFTGPMVLALWLVLTRPSSAPGQIGLWLAICLLALTHVTHLLIVPVGGAVCLGAEALRGVDWRELTRRMLALVLTCVTIALAQVAANLLQFGFTSVSPAGPIFLFARLNEDGHMQPWLDRHCGHDAPAELCAIRPSLPHDSQQLLWGPGSSRYFPVSPELPHWMAQFDAANRGAIASAPLAVLGTSLRGAGEQLLDFGALDDECPAMCADQNSVLLLSFEQAGPDYAAGLRQSRQLRGTLSRPTVRSLTSPLTALALLALLPLLAVAARRRDWEAAGLIAAVASVILFNALLAGALSDVHARYQSRVAWLAPFAVLAVLLRWRGETGRSPQP